VCWKPCSSCWSFHHLREEFLSAPIHSPLSGSPYRSFNSADGPAKKEQEKMLKLHWAVLGRLRDARVTLAEEIRQYHARGVLPLRRRPLRLCEMTADPAPSEGTVTAPSLPSSLEVQRRVAQAIGRSTYSWPSSWLHPMLPNAGTEKIVSCSSSCHVLFAFCHGINLLGVCPSRLTFAPSCRCS
jgi:hypothetical protein